MGLHLTPKKSCEYYLVVYDIGRAFCCQFVDNCSGKDVLPTVLLLNEILVKFTIQKYPFNFDLGVLWLILGESIDKIMMLLLASYPLVVFSVFS